MKEIFKDMEEYVKYLKDNPTETHTFFGDRVFCPLDEENLTYLARALNYEHN